MELRVSRRLLWVDDAAYPLHNIARVHTFELKPDRWKAFLTFLKGLAATAVALVVLQVANEDSGPFSSSGYGSDDTADTLWTFAFLVAFGLFVWLLTQLFARPEHVLSVETSGPPVALVTLPDKEQLRQLVGQIVHAIENPTAEFAVQVQRVGDTVNIYGGQGHTGVKK
ncbi:DUF6232 family protein [Streptomyces sp. NBC_01351]|uniref:DUF6232 family protein n=1 Tax=Streptomyces sp. NBC_01351 TaxID=2903833 RepID=UPI002E30765E|nr:DUF6232 family protein [Streptomyces sp. NBC_01351]